MALRVGARLPDALVHATVLDHAGASVELGELRGLGPAVFVFLRHFGCTACTEHVSMLMPAIAHLPALGVRIVFVGNGAARYIDGFVERNGVLTDIARVVTDPSLKAFDAAGMVRSRWSTFGPRGLLNLARSLARGFKQTTIEGEPLQQGGVIVVAADGTIAYVQVEQAAGDHAPNDEVVAAAMRVAALGMRGA